MTPFDVLGFKVDGERMQAVGSILVMIWVPILTYLVYPLCEKLGLRPTALRRMGVGMVLAGVTYVISGWMQGRIDAGVKLSLAWQLVPYIVLVAGEVLVSATGLEYAFAEGAQIHAQHHDEFLAADHRGRTFPHCRSSRGLNARFVHASGPRTSYTSTPG